MSRRILNAVVLGGDEPAHLSDALEASGLNVIGRANDAFTAQELAKSVRPECAVVAVRAGSDDDLRLIEDVRGINPDCAILAIVQDDRDRGLAEQIGANLALLKPSVPNLQTGIERLRSAIDEYETDRMVDRRMGDRREGQDWQAVSQQRREGDDRRQEGIRMPGVSDGKLVGG